MSTSHAADDVESSDDPREPQTGGEGEEAPAEGSTEGRGESDAANDAESEGESHSGS
jgi:hypothetical protein